MTERQRIAAYLDFVRPVAGDVVRMALGDREAVQLAGEMVDAGIAFARAEAMENALPALADALEAGAPADTTDTVALMAYTDSLRAAVGEFWDAFEGQVCDGVTIIRRRA